MQYKLTIFWQLLGHKSFPIYKENLFFFLVKQLRGSAALNPLARLAFQRLSGLSAALSPPCDVVVVAAKSMGACLRQSLIWTRDFGHLLWEGRRNHRVSGETQCLEQRWRAVIMAFETENKHASCWTARDHSKKKNCFHSSHPRLSLKLWIYKLKRSIVLFPHRGDGVETYKIKTRRAPQPRVLHKYGHSFMI